MMKKRILASSMASVMALSSVSVVAFADEKTKDYGEAVTKAELEAYLESLESFVDEKLDDYGFVQGEDFTAAVAHANDVLADSRAKATDYTAAYQMVKSVKDNLRIYSATELKALVKQHKAAYDSENVLNKSIGDKVYSEETFSEFADAYVDAEGNVDSDDARSITDAYVALEKAADKLEEKSTVKKSELRNSLRAYEALEAKMADYETWRRGTVTEKPSTGKKADLTKLSLSFGDLCYIVYDDNVYTTDKIYTYWDGSQWSEVAKGANNFFIGTGKVDRGDGDKLYDTLKNIYKDLDELKGVTETSDDKYIEARKALDEAVKIFNSWKADDLKSGTKTAAKSVESKYHAQLVEAYNYADAEKIADAIVGFTSGTNKYEVTFDFDKHTMKANKTVYAVVDKDGYIYSDATITADQSVFATLEDAKNALASGAHTGIKGATYATFSMSTNLYTKMKYTVVDFADMQTAFQALEAALSVPTDCSEGTDVYFSVNTTVGATATKDYKKVSADVSTNATAVAEAKAYNEALDVLKAKYNQLETMSKNQENVDNLVTVMGHYNTYKDLDFQSADTKEDAKDTATAIMNELTEGGPQLQTINGSSKEWTLIWRELSYGLDDVFPVAKKTDKTLAKLYKLIEDSYDTTEKTGDSAAFADFHMAVVDARQEAYEFYKIAKAEGKSYDEGDTINGTTLDKVYKALDDANKNLTKAYDEFSYSYEDIRTAIGTYAIALDNGEVKGDALKKAINDCAYRLSVLEVSKVKKADGELTNFAFDDQGVFQPANRLKTDKQDKATDVKANQFEKDLKKSYEAMVKAYDEAKNGKTSTVKNDFNGDGKFTSDDLLDALSAFTASSTDTKYDANGDGKFTTDDLLVILADFTAQA